MFGINANQGARGTASIDINRPVSDVFNYIGVDFFTNYPRWSPEVVELEMLSEPPLQLHSLFRQVRVDHGQRSESTFSITTYSVDQRLVFEGVSHAYRCSYEFIATNRPANTQLIFTFALLKLELFMLPFEKLIRIAMQDGAYQTVQNLKHLIESSSK